MIYIPLFTFKNEIINIDIKTFKRPWFLLLPCINNIHNSFITVK